MSSFNLLNISNQAMRVNQAALSAIGQNVTNVNTPGYSRQVAHIQSLPDRTGAYVDSIDRITDRFLTRQLWADLSAYNQSEAYVGLANQVDDWLATEVTSVSNTLDNYFSALQNVVDDPISLPNRELFVAEADALVKRFHDLDSHLRSQSDTLDQKLADYGDQVSTLAGNIAQLNDQIVIAKAANNPANELQDQREELTNQLAALVGINVIEQDGDVFNIFIGNGEPLVVGGQANQLITAPSDPDRSQLSLQLRMAGGRRFNVHDQISGGTLGGLLQYRNQVLNEARDELGRIAVGFAESMNRQHQAGMDLNNQLGQNLFGDINTLGRQHSRIMAQSGNQSNVTSARVEVTDISQLKASDYTLVYDNENQISLVRNSDNKIFKINQLDDVSAGLTPPFTDQDGISAVDDGDYYLAANQRTLSFSVDGMQVTIETSTTLTSGDQFLIQPVRDGAEALDLVVRDGRKLALASPVRVSADNNNQGSGVAAVTVTDAGGAAFASYGQLTPPLSVVFNTPTAPTAPLTYTLYDLTDPLAPQPYDPGTGVLQNIAYDPAEGATIELDGYQIRLTNRPEPGDRFTFAYNTGGFSDNRNALLMSDLQQADLMDGGAYQDLYGSLVERVGTRTATARITLSANKSVLDSTVTAKSSVAGVNLDEEAAKLVQFQQAYKASAQLLSASQTLFDALINSL